MSAYQNKLKVLSILILVTSQLMLPMQPAESPEDRARRLRAEATVLLHQAIQDDSVIGVLGALARGADVNGRLGALDKSIRIEAVCPLATRLLELRDPALIFVSLVNENLQRELAELDYTPLMRVVNRGNKGFLLELLLDQRGARINDRCFAGTALHIGLHLKRLDIVKLLLARRIDRSIKNGNGLNALHCVALNGQLDSVQELLKGLQHLQESELIESKTEKGFTALQCAVQEGHVDVVRFLLERGADFNAGGPAGTALQIALRGAAIARQENRDIANYITCAQLLLYCGTDLQMPSAPRFWNTAATSLEVLPECARLLIVHGYDGDRLDEFLQHLQPLECAAAKGDMESITALLEQEGPEATLLQALSYTVGQRNHDVVQLLLSKLNPWQLAMAQSEMNKLLDAIFRRQRPHTENHRLYALIRQLINQEQSDAGNADGADGAQEREDNDEPMQQEYAPAANSTTGEYPEDTLPLSTSSCIIL
jgi:hypothetical protein